MSGGVSAACAVGLAVALAAGLATGQRERQLAQLELNGLANGYALTLQFGISTYMRKIVALRTLFDTVGTTTSRDQFATFYEAASQRPDRHRRHGMAAARAAGPAGGARTRRGTRGDFRATVSNPSIRTAPARPLRIGTNTSRYSMPRPSLLILRHTVRITMTAACGSGRLRSLAMTIARLPVRIWRCEGTASAFWWLRRCTVRVHPTRQCRNEGSI